MRTLEKDILLICKNWYNKEKYNLTLEALNGYEFVAKTPWACPWE